MKSQMEEIANLAKKAEQVKAEYRAKTEALIAEGLPLDEFMNRTRSLMCEELGSYHFYLKAIAQWSELAFAEA